MYGRSGPKFRQYAARQVVDGIELPQKVLVATTTTPDRFVDHHLAGITTKPSLYVIYLYDADAPDPDRRMKMIKTVTVTPLLVQHGA